MNHANTQKQNALLKSIDTAMAREIPQNVLVDMALGNDIKASLRKKDTSISFAVTTRLQRLIFARS